MLENYRCGNCTKLLARILGTAELQIKCSRCGTLNHMKALSLRSSPSSDTHPKNNYLLEAYMQIELPPLIIYPDDHGTSRPTGLQNPFPATMIGRMIDERSSAYSQGHWREMVTSHLKAMKTTRPIPYTLTDFMIRELKAGSGADLLMLHDKNLAFTQAWNQAFEATKTNLSVSQMVEPIEFSGGIFTPFKAIAHWIFGKGQQAKVNINNIEILPSPQKIPLLQAALNDAPLGVSLLDLTFPYNTGMDSSVSRIYLGSITLRATGTVEKQANGQVSLLGEIRAFSDTYDANASSHRGGFDETATTALREVGRLANAQTYEILIEGQLPINFNQ